MLESLHLLVFSSLYFNVLKSVEKKRKKIVCLVWENVTKERSDCSFCSLFLLKALSKKHACIEVQRDLHLIHDCESKNKTKKGKVVILVYYYLKLNFIEF